jgi:branched-chain amino acid transport system substrate-binding protein
MNARPIVLLLAVCALAAGYAEGSGKGWARDEPVRVGVIATMTGENAGNGRTISDTARMAMDQVNDAGGLDLGGKARRVQLVMLDDLNSPEGAVDAARALIHREDVAAIVGPQFSRNAIPASRIAEDTGIPMICPMSTNPETTRGKRYVFRIPYLDTFQGTVMARFAWSRLEARRAAVLFDVANVYNREIAGVFRKAFTGLGGEVVAFERYTTDQARDYAAQLARIAAAGPHVLYLPNYAADAEVQARQARELGIDAVLLGSDGWEDGRFRNLPSFQGSYLTRHWHPDIETEASRRFLRDFNDRYERVPDDVAATYYDAFQLLFTAIRLEGSADPSRIRDGLYRLEGFQGVTGSIEYRECGDPVKSAVIIEIRGGESSFFAQVEP